MPTPPDKGATLNDAVLRQTDEVRLQQAQWWGGNPSVRGPALVYTAWNGRSCGIAHNFTALQQAAQRLGVPLYVINEEIGQPLNADRPGTRLSYNNASDMINALSRHQLFLQDPHVRLVDAGGNVVGRGDIVSGQGAAAIVNAFAPLVQRMRGRAEIDNGHARA